MCLETLHKLLGRETASSPPIRIARSAQTVKRLDLFAGRETPGPLVTLTDDDPPAESPDGL
jgi:hypothetical protein